MLSSTIQATLAFVFNQDLSKVVLIQKEKPVQHAGLLNGLGGKLEAGESHRECVSREVKEESGMYVAPYAWITVGTMSWANWSVSIWTCAIDVPPAEAFSQPTVSWYSIDSLPENVIENLEWLIPLSIDINRKAMKKEASLPVVDIVYSSRQSI